MSPRAAGRSVGIILAFAAVLSAGRHDWKGRQVMRERQWGEIKEGLAISIAVNNDHLETLDNVVLNLVLKNFGAAPVLAVVRSPWVDYIYVVHDDRGHELVMTSYGQQRAEGSREGRMMVRNLQPGESQSEDFELSKGFDLKHTSTVSIFATRTFPWPGHPGESFTVRSNAVTLHLAS